MKLTSSDQRVYITNSRTPVFDFNTEQSRIILSDICGALNALTEPADNPFDSALRTYDQRLDVKIPDGLTVTSGALLVSVQNAPSSKVTEPIVYDYNYFNELLYTGSINPAIIDMYGRPGWFWTNSLTTGASNLYWYANSAIPQNEMTKVSMDTIYVILSLDRVSPYNTLPFVAMYSRETGTGDILPGFAHSKWVYTISSLEALNAGETILLYIGDPLTITDVHPELRRIQLSLASQSGDALPGEIINHISLNTDSSLKAVNAIQYLVKKAGFHYLDSIIEYAFDNGVQKVISDNLYENGIRISNTVQTSDSNTQAINGKLNTADAPYNDSVKFYQVNNPTSIDIGTLPAIAITNTSFDVLNVVDVSGTLTVNTITGFATETTASSSSTKLDTINTTINSKHLSTALDSVTVSGSVIVNTISGFATETTASSALTKLDTINTTLLNKHLSTALDSVTVSGSVIVNTISGFATETTASSALTKLDTINTTLLNKHLDKALDSVSISGQTIFSNLKAYDATLDGYFDLTSTGIGAHVSCLDVAVKNAVTISGGVTLLNTGLATETTLQGVNTSVARLHADTVNADAIQVQVKNTSLDAHMFASTNGTTWHHLKADANGALNVHSQVQDGGGSDITSTVSGLDRGLDVHVINTSNIPVSIGAVSLAGGCVPAALNDGFNNSITSTSTALHNSIDTYINNPSLKSLISDASGNPLTSTGGALDINVKTGSLTITSVNIKDSSGNSMKADASGNLNVQINAYNRTGALTSNLTTVQPVGASSTVKALETYSYVVGLNNALNIPLQITSSTTGEITQSLDTYVNNPGSTNYSYTGLNVYNILPKILTYTIGGYDDNTGNNTLIGGDPTVSTNGLRVIDWNFGKPNHRNFYAALTSGTPKVLKYDYIDLSGNLITTGSVTVNSSTSTNLGDIVSIANFRLEQTLGLSEAVYIGVTNTNLTTLRQTSFYAEHINHKLISVFTIPNGYIGRVTSVNGWSNGSTNISIIKWSTTGVRSTLFKYNNQVGQVHLASGFEGCLGGILVAGETIAFAVQGGVVGGKYQVGNVTLQQI
jgi:hypothetical protein